VAVVFAAGCGADPFVCSSNGQCLEGGAQGICQPSGVCSFDDDDCESGQRFGEHAGALANMCVPPDLGGSTGTPNDDTTSAAGTTVAVGGDASSSGGRDEGSSDVGEDSTTASENSTGASGFPNGDSCTEPSECQSGHCYVIPMLGGLCGECTSDADCRYGCGTANPLLDPPAPSTCDDGLLGAGCESDDSCESDFVCAAVLDIPGVITVGTCGTCRGSGDCGSGQACNLIADYVTVQGQHECVTVGSEPDGETCSLPFDGEAACANHCAPVSVMGLFELGVCGECRDGADCGNGGTCLPGRFNFGDPPVPSQCG